MGNTKGGASKSKRGDKQQKIVEEDAGVCLLDNGAPNDSSVGVHKKEKAPVQPTATQIMLSQLIGGEQKNMDEVQRNKIQQVIDITGKPEDAVATALYDAGWDEHRAIDLLLEGGDHLTA